MALTNVNFFFSVFSGAGTGKTHRHLQLSLFIVSCVWVMSLFVSRPVDAAEQGKLIEVGAQRAVKTLAEASRLAKDGDIVEVDAGDYLRDVAVWTQNDLILRAKNGRARLIAQGCIRRIKRHLGGAWREYLSPRVRLHWSSCP